MIGKYYEVTIFWGGSGRPYAQKMAEKLESLHRNEYLPIRPYIFDKQAMSADSIMTNVIEKVGNSTACIIILTFDDEFDNGKVARVRQNILIETGVAWARLGSKNLFFMSDKESLPDDFPSNIRTGININHFDKDDPDKIVSRISDTLIHENSIISNRDILTPTGRYIYDGKILGDLDSFAGETKTEAQIDRIKEHWLRMTGRFDYIQEKVLYIMERVAFFPILGNEEKLLRFLHEIEKLVEPSEYDYEHYDKGEIPEQLLDAMKLTRLIIRYTEEKIKKETKECRENPTKNKTKTRNVEHNFRLIYDELVRIIRNFEEKKYDFIWLIKIIAYDYAALCKMRMFEIDPEPESEENKRDLDEAIGYLEKAAELAENDNNSGDIWNGFLYYNLGRAYYKKYTMEKDRSLTDKIDFYLSEATNIRKKWLNTDYFRGVFASALSFEYFIASLEQSRIRHICDGFDDDDEDILESVKELRTELNEYCMESELGILYGLRDKIDDFIESMEK